MAININNLNNAQVNARQVEQQNTQQKGANAPQSAQNQAAAARPDSVSLTNSAQQMGTAQKKAQNASGFDQEKVDKIKLEISEGRYKVNADKLAANIISAEGKLFG
ncbi:flagellar biosynthesis anti-sigma factor FlgM [Algibacillus agarilyticus]|uniref:flagellar biosynthesis anti-sigma factor FlgM n=1 Tax=Algibacillus agarilyticus TaxID=2234133 RepID=UPI000DD038A7|nr:flagellar biosynthesis anti-sigma factor FlgM [Algibacillus agarilyticus]